jgi:hypothetical protein
LKTIYATMLAHYSCFADPARVRSRPYESEPIDLPVPFGDKLRKFPLHFVVCAAYEVNNKGQE